MRYLQYVLFFAVVLAVRYFGPMFLDYLGKERLVIISRVSLVLIFINFGIFIFGLYHLFNFNGASVQSSSQTYTLENPKVSEETQKTSTSVETRKSVFIGKENSKRMRMRMTYGELWRGLKAGDRHTIYFACTVFGMFFFIVGIFVCVFIYAYTRR